MKVTSLLVILNLLFSFVYSQSIKVRYETSLELGISNKDKTPFWIYNNQIVPAPDNKGFGVLTGGLYADYFKNDNNRFDFTWGSEFQSQLADKSDIYLRQIYGGVKWKKIQLMIGMKKDPVMYDNLSSTNVNFIYSNIARPYPRISLSLPEYIDVPFTKGWLAFKAFYSDGMLIDDRYVDKPYVHYKNAYFKIGTDWILQFEFGLHHYVVWGGESRDSRFGKLPKSLSVYKDVILAKDDSEYDVLGNPNTDFNRVGNQLGMYDLRLTYESSKYFVQVYRQVIFEDASGQNIFNRDAMFGLYINLKKNKPWLQSFLYEFYTTKHQSGSTPGGSPKPDGGVYTGRDNYFNHSVYRSGWTNYQRSIGTPFFTPVTNDDIAFGIDNNRIRAHHLGLKGNFLNKIPYRALLSYTDNKGTYSNPKDYNQVSGLLEVEINQFKLPFKIITGLAIDKNSLLDEHFGIYLKISKSGIFE